MSGRSSFLRAFFGLVGGLALWAATPTVADAATPEELFKTNCGACHTIGAGKLVGPDLRGVEDRRDRAWLEKFVKSSQSMIDAGDAEAVKLFEEYNKVPMPDPPISEDEIKQVLDFIAESNKGGKVVTLIAAAAAESHSPEDVKKGQEMFQGRIRFSAGGPACNSCHEVQNDAVIGGGVLAKELTSVMSTMGGAGVQAVLGKPPFPVMEQAYRDHELTKDEIKALTAFLADADKNKAFQKPRDYGERLFVSGVVGVVVLLGLYALIWRRRKRLPVNHAIFARQVESQ